jgi:DNA-binding MltR family transcriptional regulator
MSEPRDLADRIVNLAKSDAGHVIVAVAIIDQLLEELILAYLPKMADDAAIMLFEHGGPFGSLPPKARFARAVGLIEGDTHNDLKAIQKIRNAFAHPRGFLHFASPEIAAEFQRLKHWPSTENPKALFDERVAVSSRTIEAKIQNLIWEHATAK